MANLSDKNSEQKTVQNNTNEDALLFDESTILSRKEEDKDEEEIFDNSGVSGNAEDSGNENIQTLIRVNRQR
ncbi:hypothetical protein [Oceanospirillum sediminis]|uniref:Uncharacterized protein n=1 Tax=Oceanospirillum sediminis TaxID=2760088 RepID=A0A839IY78_9GAMM|nr:hypothetical protein [Oceanospirillum sediminis]MBB1489921.1 hypothetical protein [Oceanospirillum sediminis]